MSRFCVSLFPSADSHWSWKTSHRSRQETTDKQTSCGRNSQQQQQQQRSCFVSSVFCGHTHESLGLKCSSCLCSWSQTNSFILASCLEVNKQHFGGLLKKKKKNTRLLSAATCWRQQQAAELHHRQTSQLTLFVTLIFTNTDVWKPTTVNINTNKLHLKGKKSNENEKCSLLILCVKQLFSSSSFLLLLFCRHIWKQQIF